jgi:hypothetical protein
MRIFNLQGLELPTDLKKKYAEIDFTIKLFKAKESLQKKTQPNAQYIKFKAPQSALQ